MENLKVLHLSFFNDKLDILDSKKFFNLLSTQQIIISNIEKDKNIDKLFDYKKEETDVLLSFKSYLDFVSKIEEYKILGFLGNEENHVVGKYIDFLIIKNPCFLVRCENLDQAMIIKLKYS